ncbi:uncharacterized protein LOC113204239 [Frankliniella occidentalis]|uniref:Uncharacterized protein LOC113204239 n=1 Tax=Frankliniella occidentalis TaxID=133901 RepID=A0A6J1S3B2_FRAOC|nr:uncharacterized protein LOC113204239 [Frankliniella occidentalis]
MRVPSVAAGLLALLLLRVAGAAVPAAPRARAARVARWEGMLLHLAATLRANRALSAIHFVCRSGDQCISTTALQRLDRRMTVGYTQTVAEVLPDEWPSAPRSLYVLVDLDCRALLNATKHADDVVLLVTGGTQEEFQTQGSRVLETCWQSDLLKVLAVQRKDSGETGLRMYTYWPYYPEHCHDLRPHLVALWTPATPHRPEAFGLLPKDRDLGGCPLRVTTFKARPWTEIIPVNGSRILLHTGTFKPLILTLARYLNFTPTFYLPLDGKIFGRSDDFPKSGGILGDLYFNRSDLGLMFTGADLKLPYHARPATAQVSCTTWCLPTGFNTRSPWRLIIGEFTTEAWGAVLVSYLVAILSYRLLLPNRTFRETWLTALQGLISGISPIPESAASRVFIFCWSFAGLVLGTLYMAALHRITTTETDDTVFHSVTDLADSELPMFATTEHVAAYKKAQFDTASEQRLWRRAVTFNYDQVLPVFGRLFARRDLAVLMDRNQCRSYSITFTARSSAPAYHMIRNYCLAVSPAYNLILRQGSPLLRAFTKATARLDEAGITNFWFDFKEMQYTATLDPVLRMRQLVPFLKMLGIGCAAGLVMFILELVWFGCSKCGTKLGPRTRPQEIEQEHERGRLRGDRLPGRPSRWPSPPSVNGESDSDMRHHMHPEVYRQLLEERRRVTEQIVQDLRARARARAGPGHWDRYGGAYLRKGQPGEPDFMYY